MYGTFKTSAPWRTYVHHAQLRGGRMCPRSVQTRCHGLSFPCHARTAQKEQWTVPPRVRVMRRRGSRSPVTLHAAFIASRSAAAWASCLARWSHRTSLHVGHSTPCAGDDPIGRSVAITG